MPSDILPIIELYVAIQGEGSKAGLVNILLRFTGCTHRCCFSGDWCDSWYSSLHPEKGQFDWPMIVEFFHKYQHIQNLMLTGGSPTMYPELLQKIIAYFKKIHQDQAFVTLETEGSHFIETEPRIDLVSLSPKLSNSIPVLGTYSPKGHQVDVRWIQKHEKYRMQLDIIRKMIQTHKDYHLKIVLDQNDSADVWNELRSMEEALEVPREKIFLMPAGSNLSRVQKNYAYLLPICAREGYSFSGRAHIVAFGNQRGV